MPILVYLNNLRMGGGGIPAPDISLTGIRRRVKIEHDRIVADDEEIIRLLMEVLPQILK